MARRIYVDSNIFIYLLDGSDDLRQRTLAKLAASEVEEAKLITSELTIAECTIAPLREKRKEIVEAFQALLYDSEIVELISVTHDVIVQSAEIAAELKLKLPDAIHVATAIVAGCDTFLSNDRGIRAPAGIEIQHL